MNEHARHILSTLGFAGEELELQVPALATYLESYVVGAERQRCARVAIGQVDAAATGDPADASYNAACDHIAGAILAGGKA